jgi:hypothetical protein
MFATTIYLDKHLPQDSLAEAVSAATGVAVDEMRVITQEEFNRSHGQWFRNEDQVGLRTSTLRGDFPFVIDMFVRPEIELRSVLDRFARAQNVAILTDEYDVNPLSDAEWLMVCPDGSSTRMIADPEEFGADDPGIVLEPNSRRMYESIRFQRQGPMIAPS